MLKKNDFIRYIHQVSNYPKDGVTYLDLNPLYMNPYWPKLLDGLKLNNGAKIMAIESRGFIMAGAICQRHKMGFIPVRKKGKLPGPTLSITYDLEYGTDALEIQQIQGKHAVYLVDDVVATGGTLGAAYKLAEMAGFAVVGAISLINIPKLNTFVPKKVDLQSIFKAQIANDGYYEIA